MPADPVRFAAALREAGLAVPVDAVATFQAALSHTDPQRVDQALWASRATLVRRPDDLALHDEVFARCFVGDQDELDGRSSSPPPVPPRSPPEAPDGGGRDHDERVAPARRQSTVRFTVTETLRHRDFAECTPEELAQVRRAIDGIRRRHRTVRSRRRRAGRTGELDLRRTVAATIRAKGDTVALRHVRRSTRPRRLVLLLDVSGSMAPYAEPLLHFGHAALRARGRVEVFALATRCTRLTRALGAASTDEALAAASTAVEDWDGGTRLGDDLATFLDGWGQRGAARGADVVILSDGWDQGDPAHLAAQMARLSRLAARIVWVNPLRAQPGYQPLARGMAAALPYCDRFVDGHSLAALEHLADLLGEP